MLLLLLLAAKTSMEMIAALPFVYYKWKVRWSIISKISQFVCNIVWYGYFLLGENL